MKFLRICLGAPLICLTLIGQEPPKVTEPEYANKYFLLQPDGSLKALEQAQSTMQNKVTKSQTFPVARVNTKTFAQVEGDKSPVRLAATQNPQFVVRLGSREYDPADYLRLYKEYIEEGQRRVDVTYFKSGGKDFMKQEDVSEKSVVPVTYEKFGEKSFKLTPKSPLSSGEYCLSTKGAADASCFGVD